MIAREAVQEDKSILLTAIALPIEIGLAVNFDGVFCWSHNTLSIAELKNRREAGLVSKMNWDVFIFGVVNTKMKVGIGSVAGVPTQSDYLPGFDCITDFNSNRTPG